MFIIVMVFLFVNIVVKGLFMFKICGNIVFINVVINIGISIMLFGIFCIFFKILNFI